MSRLEQSLLSMSTFPNGCGFRLRKDQLGTYWLEYGCYGVHVNLVQGDQRWLVEWLEESSAKSRSLESVSPEIIAELLKRKPCERCGGFLFAAD